MTTSHPFFVKMKALSLLILSAVLLFCLARGQEEDDDVKNTFIVEFNDICKRKCRSKVRKAARKAGCNGCKLGSLGRSEDWHEDFMKLSCKRDDRVTAKKLKQVLQNAGLPVYCVEEDSIGYAQGFPAVELEPTARHASGLLWNIDEMDGGVRNGKRCDCSLLGDSVIVVVMDTGCTPPNHSGYEAIRCRNYVRDRVHPPCRDGQGHGNHIAGVISSPDYGVAPLASLACMRVLNDRGRGSFSNFIRAINDVTRFARTSWLPVVINLSLAGRKSRALNDAVRAAARAGVYIAVAAGNFNQDARRFSPVSATDNQYIFAVGAHDHRGRKARFSNWGPLVKLTGPGVNILSDGKHKGTRSRKSGTSMAAPHVAAAIAVLLSDGYDPSLHLLQSRETVSFPRQSVHKAKYFCQHNG